MNQPHKASPQQDNPQTNTTCGCAGHNWDVFSTAIRDGCLMVNCTECGAMGTVDDPSSEEWSQALHAPSKPYHWPHNSRVTVRHTVPIYVESPPGSGRSGRILTSEEPLSSKEREELEMLERVVIDGNLDGGLFPHYIRSFEEYSGNEVTTAVKRLASRIEELVQQRRVFTPAMMSIVIREFLRESD